MVGCRLLSGVMTWESSHHVSCAGLSVVVGSAYCDSYHNTIAGCVRFAAARWGMHLTATQLLHYISVGCQYLRCCGW